MLIGCLLDSVWWSLELGVGGEDPEEGLLNAVDNPPTNPHLKLGYHLAHDYLVLLQHLSKKPEITTY